MKIQREGRRPINLPSKLAERLIAKGNFKAAEPESEEEKAVRMADEKAKLDQVKLAKSAIKAAPKKAVKKIKKVGKVKSVKVKK